MFVDTYAGLSMTHRIQSIALTYTDVGECEPLGSKWRGFTIRP